MTEDCFILPSLAASSLSAPAPSPLPLSRLSHARFTPRPQQPLTAHSPPPSQSSLTQGESRETLRRSDAQPLRDRGSSRPPHTERCTPVLHAHAPTHTRHHPRRARHRCTLSLTRHRTQRQRHIASVFVPAQSQFSRRIRLVNNETPAERSLLLFSSVSRCN